MNALIVALVGISGVLVGMSVVGRARHGSAREWVGATLMLASVLFIPIGGVLWAV
ncbi:hypothetical protein SEA_SERENDIPITOUS_94 [Mycobacterium phage Serendipitous]|uniref:Uncharacterized protein n=1 Tax=Mycobacterium phage Serendipitous TaxID=2301619 RepID=A0A385UHV0_9CAUD|nr:hypothetical protein I5G64_gp94 [Mycobacterium phage Serendipitous]AYB70635.1 hypothetical protein SEA_SERENDIPITOUS_94 [Mycobacterium phage Serendipitous]